MRKPPLFFIGSLPFSNPAEAIDFVRRASPTFPFLPQLPGVNPQEDMVGQVLRGCELGCWDESASISFPGFLEAFADAPRVKFKWRVLSLLRARRPPNSTRWPLNGWRSPPTSWPNFGRRVLDRKSGFRSMSLSGRASEYCPLTTCNSFNSQEPWTGDAHRFA